MRTTTWAERCHGGDPAMDVARWAHRGVLHSTVLRSSVNRANLPRTCAPCHAAQAEAFTTACTACCSMPTNRGRVLFDLPRRDGRARAVARRARGHVRALPPVRVAAVRLSPHGASRHRGNRADPHQAGRVLDAIAGVGDPVWRGQLRTAWDAATRATTTAVTAFHAFDLPRMAESLEVARRETDSMTRELER